MSSHSSKKLAAVRETLVKSLGAGAVLHRAEDLALYEYDGGVDKMRPELVVFPRTTEDIASIVRLARENGLSLVGRGAGTGLSGGSIPREGGMLIGFSRMNRILSLDARDERAVVQPGVVNLDLHLAAQTQGCFFAPDPSSQRACTIGGNVAENAGGPHTLAYGVTTNHVLGLECVLPDGSVIQTGGDSPDLPGYDLTGLLTGSEGTMALIASATVRIMPGAEAVKTILAIYNSTDDCADTVAELTARLITPVAVEMLDGPMLRMVEEATHAGYPMDAAAVLLIELEGPVELVEEQVEQIRAVCEACRAREFRIARTPEERDLLWKGRKNAFGAIGRMGASYYVQDGVVPRSRIADTLRHIEATGQKYGLKISNIFHAGDGNMHPIILFDQRKPGDLERAQKVGEEILTYCVEAGGSITGEHGVGMEKNEMMPRQFSPDSLAMIGAIKDLFDPGNFFNPGKVLPLGKGCLEIRQAPLTTTSTIY